MLPHTSGSFHASGSTETPDRRLAWVPAAAVRPERVEWLEDCWIPRRSLTLLAGREGLGKSTIACDLAARATRGELDNGTRMNVAYIATEDPRSMVIVPRLMAARADLARVGFIDVHDVTGGSQLDLPRDADVLDRFIAENRIGLMILDAAKSAMNGTLNDFKDSDVRRYLEPLARIADRNDCAIVGLVHFGKRESNDTGKLIMGSAAWSQVARSVLSVAVDDESGSLVVENTKGNLAPRTVARAAQIVTAAVDLQDGGPPSEVGRVEWMGETDIRVTDLLSRSSDGDDAEERSEVEAVLLDYLESQGGSAPAGEVLKVARAAGLSERTVKRVRSRLGIKTTKSGGAGSSWVWSIDHPKGAKDQLTPYTPGPFGPLTPLGDSPSSEGVSKGPQRSQEEVRGQGAKESDIQDTPGLFTPDPLADAPTVEVADPDDIDRLILGCLDSEHPISARVVAGGIPARCRNGLDIDARLVALVDAGKVALRARGYVRAS